MAIALVASACLPAMRPLGLYKSPDIWFHLSIYPSLYQEIQKELLDVEDQIWENSKLIKSQWWRKKHWHFKHLGKNYEKTSPKGFSLSKCDEGNRIFSKKN
jgi:hypothetical protein